MKIVNLKRFLTVISVCIGLIAIFTVLLNTNSMSSTEFKYSEYIVESNDTLWDIANLVKQYNPYYEKYDTREIVYEIKDLNNMRTSDLYVNQKLMIPEI